MDNKPDNAVSLDGLLNETPEQDNEEKDRLLTNFDNLISSMLMKLAEFDVRLGKCEEMCSYLLSKDPTVAAKLKEMAQAAAAGEAHDQGKRN